MHFYSEQWNKQMLILVQYNALHLFNIKYTFF